jgi:hypothetical protein
MCIRIYSLYGALCSPFYSLFFFLLKLIDIQLIFWKTSVSVRYDTAVGFQEILTVALWGEVSMCDTPPTLIIPHVNLVQHFINATRITTDNMDMKSTSRFLDTDTCQLLLVWKVPTALLVVGYS